MLCKLVSKDKNNCCNCDKLDKECNKRLYIIVLFNSLNTTCNLNKNEDTCCNKTAKETCKVELCSAEDIVNIAVSTATEKVNEGCLILDRNGKTVEHYVGKSSECKHSCQCYDERRNSYKCDPEALESTDCCTKKDHANNC